MALHVVGNDGTMKRSGPPEFFALDEMCGLTNYQCSRCTSFDYELHVVREYTNASLM